MVIPGMFIACFAALSASSFNPLIPMCAGTLHKVICFPGYGALLVCQISHSLDGSLCCSQWPAMNSASLYILPISYTLFLYHSHCCHFSCVDELKVKFTKEYQPYLKH